MDFVNVITFESTAVELEKLVRYKIQTNYTYTKWILAPLSKTSIVRFTRKIITHKAYSMNEVTQVHGLNINYLNFPRQIFLRLDPHSGINPCTVGYFDSKRAIGLVI